MGLIYTISNLRGLEVTERSDNNFWSANFLSRKIKICRDFLIHRGNCWTHEFFKERGVTIKNGSDFAMNV